MRKALNWTFSGFFRSLGRALFWLLIIIFLSLILSYNDIKLPNIWSVLDVNANTVTPTYYNNGFDYISGAKIYNWSSSTNYSELNNTQVYDTSNSDISYSTIFNGNVSNFGSNGISIIAYISNISLITNSYYSTTLYICYENNVNINMNNVYISNTYVDTFNNSVSYKKEILSNTIERSQFVDSGDTTTNYCRAISYIYQPSKDGNVINTRLTSSASLGNWYIVGQKTEYIGVADGLTSSQVNNVINNAISSSDLATANDIQSVENAIDDMNSNIEQGTQDIIDNQNANSEAQIDSQKVCSNTILKYNNVILENRILLENGSENTGYTGWGITDYLEVKKIKVSNLTGYSPSLCFYTDDKTLISCKPYNQLSENQIITLPNNTKYARFSIKNDDKPQFEVELCKNGNQAMQDTMTNDDSSGASSDASSFFDNFTSNTHGLTGIITAPLNAINSLTSQTCTPLVLPLPFVNQNLTLPCMRPIYEEHFSDFMQIYDIITLGIISYWVMVRIFSLVKDFKNPEHDEVEVLDL